MGLTVVGTLVTLWPTMLRTRIAEGAERAARRALPLLLGAVAVTATGALTGLTSLAAAGVLGYLGGLVLVGVAFVATARTKPPASYPTWSVLAGAIWLAASLIALVVAVASAPSWAAVGTRLDALAVPLAAGFGAQVLLGALSYLIPVVLGGGPAAAPPTGETTRVAVQARGMRFIPSRIEVPAGNRLVIDLTNTDDQHVHDLVLDTGQASGRLSPGESATVDAGVVGHGISSWCSVVGHRQMGMMLDIAATGPPAAASDPASPGDGAGQAQPVAPAGATRDLDFMADPGTAFTAHDPALPPLPSGTVHRRTLTVRELDRDVAPGVSQRLWTFGGTAPGPTLHGGVGDVFEITLVNSGDIGHSIDFHAGALAPAQPMRTIASGESLVYRFTATRAGIWMYHCSSMPMSAHIATGFGRMPALAAARRSPPPRPRAASWS
jgi:nitrite reductase (NO-forming)